MSLWAQCNLNRKRAFCHTSGSKFRVCGWNKKEKKVLCDCVDPFSVFHKMIDFLIFFYFPVTKKPPNPSCPFLLAMARKACVSYFVAVNERYGNGYWMNVRVPRYTTVMLVIWVALSIRKVLVFRQSLPYKWSCVRYCATSFPGLLTDLRVIKDQCLSLY